MAGSLQMAALSLYVLTFNCGQSLINVDAFASQLFTGLSNPQLPDLLVLCLQEIAPIPKSLVGGSFLAPYFARLRHAVEKAGRKASSATDGEPVYSEIAVRNLGMTAIMVFAKDPAAIHDIETAGVGVGLWNMGNKGAVGVRFVFHGEGGSTSTDLTFVAAHLAPMENGLERRNEDWKQIVRGLVFSVPNRDSIGNSTPLSTTSDSRPLLSSSPQDSSIYKPTSHLFVAGDLNYRTSITSPSPIDHITTFPQPHDDLSSPRHFSSLFQKDQLTRERLAGRTCHGLLESPITFPPTYKYDSVEPFLKPDEELSTWPWAKHRWPSWCDRILYLDVPSWMKRENPKLGIVAHKYSALPLFPTSDHRPVALEFSVPLVPIPRPGEDADSADDPRINPPFDIDMDWKANRDRARMLELLVGLGMYFTTTWEGAGVTAAMTLGTVFAYFALHAWI